jgi:spermidine/putrescine transport system permease protein
VRKFSFGKYALAIYSLLAIIYLLIPIGYTFAFSFNDSVKSNISWRGFTLDKWTGVCNQQGVCEAFANSVLILSLIHI